MITIEELSAYNRKLVDMNLKLRKENAELKERLKEHEIVGNTHFWKNVWSWKEKAEQVAKAKEHIENLLYYVKQCSCERSNYAELEHDIAKAEQFLSVV